MSFFDFFPTPKFLEMPAPGLALSDRGIKFIEFSQNGNHFSLERFGDAVLPAGILEGGEINDRESLTRALEDFRKSFRLRYIRTSLPEERAYLFRTKVPRVKGQELRVAVEATLEENVPLSVSEAIFDFVEFPGTQPSSDDQADVSVSVLSERVVSEYLSVFRDAGLVPLHFDVESQAVARALLSHHDPEVFLILNIQSAKVGLYLIYDGAVAFTSTIPFAGFSGSSITKSDPSLSILRDEIHKIVLYWQGQSEKNGRAMRPIEQITLCGPEASREGLVDGLSHASDMEVVLANVWQNAFSFDEYVPELTKQESLGYATAIGLALPQRSLFSK